MKRRYRILTLSLVILLGVSFSVLQPVYAATSKDVPYIDSEGHYIYNFPPILLGITDNYDKLLYSRPSTPTNGYYFSSNGYSLVASSLSSENNAHYVASSDNYFSGFYKSSYSINYPSGWSYLYPLIDQEGLSFNTGSEYILAVFSLVQSALASYGLPFSFTLSSINSMFRFVNSSDVSTIRSYFDSYFNPHTDLSREVGTYRLGVFISFYDLPSSVTPNTYAYKITLYTLNAYTPSVDISSMIPCRSNFGYYPVAPYISPQSVLGTDFSYCLSLPYQYRSTSGTSSYYFSDISNVKFSNQCWSIFNSYGDQLTYTQWNNYLTYSSGSSPLYFNPLASRGSSFADSPSSFLSVIVPYDLFYAGYDYQDSDQVVSTDFGYAHKCPTYYYSSSYDYTPYFSSYSLVYSRAKPFYGVSGSYIPAPTSTPSPTPTPSPSVSPVPTSSPTPAPTYAIPSPTVPPWNQPTPTNSPWSPSVAPQEPTYIPIIIYPSSDDPTPTVAPVTGYSFDWHFDIDDFDRTSEVVFDDPIIDDYSTNWFDVVFRSLGRYRNILIIPCGVGLAVYIVKRWF